MEQISSIRLKFLETLNSPDRDLALLEAMLAEVSTVRPDIFDTHAENKVYEPINSDDIDWDGPYFYRHCGSLKHNFSLERATHLIVVCRWLTEQGYAGFAIKPSPTAMHNDSGNSAMNNHNTTAFSASQSMKAALNSGSVNRLRSALVAELENNRLDNEAVREAAEWATAEWAKEHDSNLFELYEEHSLAQGFEQDSSKWDTEYYYRQSAYLNMNFARERFDHLMAIYQVLRDKAVTGFVLQPKQQPQPQTRSKAQAPSSTPDRHAPSSESTPPGSRPSALKVAMLAGGALAVLAGLILALLKHYPHILPLR